MATIPAMTRNDRAYRREKLIAAYRSGASEREIAERFSISENYAYRIVRDAKVSRSRRAGRAISNDNSTRATGS